MQGSINIVDGSGDEVLQQLNTAFEAVTTAFSGGTSPTTTYAGQSWIDTSQTNPVWKIRNKNNTEWVEIGSFTENGFQPANTVASSDSTVTKQGNTFNTANKLVKLDSQGRLPLLNGSLLTNLNIPTKQAVSNYLQIGSNHSSFEIIGGTSFEVKTTQGTKLFSVDEDTQYSFSQLLDVGTSVPGKDYSIFLVPNGQNEITPKISLNASAPEGYSVSDVLKIGGFHTLCTTISATYAPNDVVKDYNAGEIVPNSLWDNIHRPKCSPSGMGYVDLIDLWVDFYNQSGKNGAATSVYGGTRANSRQWSDHAEDFFLVGKRMLRDHEFAAAAEGSPQKVAVKGAAQPSPDITGGHQATNNMFMISKYFMWEMCGLQWQWLLEVCANGGSNWSNHDSLAGAKGQLYGSSLALLAGGYWSASSYCGSRSRTGDFSRGTVHARIGGRGACEPLNPQLIVA